MKTILFLILLVLIRILGLHAQNLDRISLSSGGAATDEVNYVIGETFNFTMADGANVIIETGTLGSIDETGGSFTTIQHIAETSPLKCFPNPTTTFLNIKTENINKKNVIIAVYDFSGRIVKLQSLVSQDTQIIDVSNFSSGTYFISVSDNQFNLIGSVKFVKQ